MYTALFATSQTLADFLQNRLENDPNLRTFFNSGLGGTMVVSLRNPEEMADKNEQGLSLWLYRVTRDEDRLYDPLERITPSLFQEPPMPLRLHYLFTPVVDTSTVTGPGQGTAIALRTSGVPGHGPLQRFFRHRYRATGPPGADERGRCHAHLERPGAALPALDVL